MRTVCKLTVKEVMTMLVSQLVRGIDYVIDDVVIGHRTPHRRWAAVAGLTALLAHNYRLAKRHSDAARRRSEVVLAG